MGSVGCIATHLLLFARDGVGYPLLLLGALSLLRWHRCHRACVLPAANICTVFVVRLCPTALGSLSYTSPIAKGYDGPLQPLLEDSIQPLRPLLEDSIQPVPIVNGRSAERHDPRGPSGGTEYTAAVPQGDAVLQHAGVLVVVAPGR